MTVSIVQQWFASLHDKLDELIRHYPIATSAEKSRMREQWNMLKGASDEMVENWLRLEDKLAMFQEMDQQGGIAEQAEELLAPFHKGQGYFKLQMYRQAAEQLEETVRAYPDMLSARLVLAMSYMHLKEWMEAHRHFRLIAALAEDAKLQAISYNALGCIQAVYANLEQAQRFFRKALEADPTFRDPQLNLDCCSKGGGELLLQFGSSELLAMV